MWTELISPPLLLTLFFRFMPELILEGHVYVAMPPLYKAIPSKGEEKYLYDDAELDKLQKRHIQASLRCKDIRVLEMDADQLWDTTLNPATRMLKRIEIEDGRLANDVTSLLMGSDVPPKKSSYTSMRMTRSLMYKHDAAAFGSQWF